jgi:hypothetical protein
MMPPPILDYASRQPLQIERQGDIVLVVCPPDPLWPEITRTSLVAVLALFFGVICYEWLQEREYIPLAITGLLCVWCIFPLYAHVRRLIACTRQPRSGRELRLRWASSVRADESDVIAVEEVRVRMCQAIPALMTARYVLEIGTTSGDYIAINRGRSREELSAIADQICQALGTET